MIIFFSRVDFIFFFYFVLSLSSVCVCVCTTLVCTVLKAEFMCVYGKLRLRFPELSSFSSFILSFGKRLLQHDQGSVNVTASLRTSCFIVLLFGRNFRSAALLLQSSPVDTIPADPIANTSFAQCESNNKLNNTHLWRSNSNSRGCHFEARCWQAW